MSAGAHYDGKPCDECGLPMDACEKMFLLSKGASRMRHALREIATDHLTDDGDKAAVAEKALAYLDELGVPIREW